MTANDSPDSSAGPTVSRRRMLVATGFGFLGIAGGSAFGIFGSDEDTRTDSDTLDENAAVGQTATPTATERMQPPGRCAAEQKTTDTELVRGSGVPANAYLNFGIESTYTLFVRFSRAVRAVDANNQIQLTLYSFPVPRTPAYGWAVHNGLRGVADTAGVDAYWRTLTWFIAYQNRLGGNGRTNIETRTSTAETEQSPTTSENTTNANDPLPAMRTTETPTLNEPLLPSALREAVAEAGLSDDQVESVRSAARRWPYCSELLDERQAALSASVSRPPAIVIDPKNNGQKTVLGGEGGVERYEAIRESVQTAVGGDS